MFKSKPILLQYDLKIVLNVLIPCKANAPGSKTKTTESAAVTPLTIKGRTF